MKKLWLSMLLIMPLTAQAEITEKDVLWYLPQTKSHKKEIVNMLNNLAKTHERCKQHIELSTVGFSKSKSSPKNPDFFVQCGEGAPEVVHFTLEDMKNNRVPGMKVAATQVEAIQACRDSVKAKAAQPNSVDFAVVGANYIDSNNGNASLTTSFSSKNAVGIQEEFKVICIFNGKNLVETTIKPF